MLHVDSAFSRIGEENAFAVLAKAAELQRQGRDIINLGIGQPDFSTPPHIVEAAVKALRDGEHGYTAATGILPLARGGRRRSQARHGVEVSPDCVLIVPGGKVTMYMAILMFGEPGVDILYPDPGFPDLSLDDRVHRREAGSGAGARGERLRLLGRGDAGADHAADAAHHHQFAGQSDRRRHAEGRDRQAGRRPRANGPTSPSCPTKSMAR